MPRMKKLNGQQRRQVTRCVGQICSDRVYTVEGLIRYAGIGREILRVARASGTVRPITIGRRSYYLGWQLVAWIESQAAQGADREGSRAAGQFSKKERDVDVKVVNHQ